MIDTAKKKSSKFITKIIRNFEVIAILAKVVKYVYRSDIVYLTISESVSGNIKDIITYLLCFPKLNQLTIHLHGGAGMIKLMDDKTSWISRINTFFLKRLANAIILGPSHVAVFENSISKEKIHIVPNFAEDYLFLSQTEILSKFDNMEIIEVLYLSNLLPAKGYVELFKAFSEMPNYVRSKFKVHFAGAFGSNEDKSVFTSEIQEFSNVEYHGVVRGEQKKNLFEKAHIFCLPTYYPYEGQPISILEAYATGCAVITTDHSGIRDVFSDKSNGYQVEKRSIESIRNVLTKIASNPEELKRIGLENNRIAQERYRTSIYTDTLKKIMNL